VHTFAANVEQAIRSWSGSGNGSRSGIGNRSRSRTRNRFGGGTRPQILNHVLNSFTFYRLHAFSDQRPW
jgi:hypothetical protein